MICDLAEIYRIYDYRGVPGRLLGTLVAGLGVESRVYQKMSGQTVPTSVLMDAMIVDELRHIAYVVRRIGGDDSQDPPESLAATLIEDNRLKKGRTFMTPEDFQKARAAILEKRRNGN